MAGGPRPWAGRGGGGTRGAAAAEAEAENKGGEAAGAGPSAKRPLRRARGSPGPFSAPRARADAPPGEEEEGRTRTGRTDARPRRTARPPLHRPRKRPPRVEKRARGGAFHLALPLRPPASPLSPRVRSLPPPTDTPPTTWGVRSVRLGPTPAHVSRVDALMSRSPAVHTPHTCADDAGRRATTPLPSPARPRRRPDHPPPPPVPRPLAAKHAGQTDDVYGPLVCVVPLRRVGLGRRVFAAREDAARERPSAALEGSRGAARPADVAHETQPQVAGQPAAASTPAPRPTTSPALPSWSAAPAPVGPRPLRVIVEVP